MPITVPRRTGLRRPLRLAHAETSPAGRYRLRPVPGPGHVSGVAPRDQAEARALVAIFGRLPSPRPPEA